MFEDVFGEEADNQMVYERVGRPAFENILEGFNSTVFAYGMTGAGKSHTMFGTAQDEGLSLRFYSQVKA